jgi:hypothetical protein
VILKSALQKKFLIKILPCHLKMFLSYRQSSHHFNEAIWEFLRFSCHVEMFHLYRQSSYHFIEAIWEFLRFSCHAKMFPLYRQSSYHFNEANWEFIDSPIRRINQLKNFLPKGIVFP